MAPTASTRSVDGDVPKMNKSEKNQRAIKPEHKGVVVEESELESRRVLRPKLSVTATRRFRLSTLNESNPGCYVRVAVMAFAES